MKHSLAVALVAFLVTAGSTRSSDQGVGWTSLFNGKDLVGWDSYLGAAKKGDPTCGWNQDPDKVFTVQTVDGAPAIRVSGQYLGGIITQREFSNYHLRLQFKWGQKRWPPREHDVRDSGLCYHCVGPYPNAARYPWPRSFEFNISEHDTGEFWSIDGTTADAEVRPIGHSPEEEAAFKGWCERNGETKPRVQFVKGGQKQSFNDGGFMPGGDYEKPAGEWNSLELYAVGQRAVHVVNGKVALVLTGLRQVVNGKEIPLTGGKIELQTESAEVFYRNIEIRPLREIPQL